MTEEELVEIAKNHFTKLDKVDKRLLTRRVIDVMEVANTDLYHMMLKGINPECFSRKKALALLPYDKELYGLLTKELQEDKEIIDIIISNPNDLPEALFKNKSAIRAVLKKYNVEGKSWATYNKEYKYLIMKPNINIQHYFLYPHGRNSKGHYPSLADIQGLTDKDPCVESKRIAEITSYYWTCFGFEFVQHID